MKATTISRCSKLIAYMNLIKRLCFQINFEHLLKTFAISD